MKQDIWSLVYLENSSAFSAVPCFKWSFRLQLSLSSPNQPWDRFPLLCIGRAKAWWMFPFTLVTRPINDYTWFLTPRSTIGDGSWVILERWNMLKTSPWSSISPVSWLAALALVLDFISLPATLFDSSRQRNISICNNFTPLGSIHILLFMSFCLSTNTTRRLFFIYCICSSCSP